MLLDTLKRAAKAERESSDPVAILFGQVTSVDPLKILVDSRFEISGEMILVPRSIGGGGGGNYDFYTGSYTITPKTTAQTLDTENKVMSSDTTVLSIPFYEVSNDTGETVYIGSEYEEPAIMTVAEEEPMEAAEETGGVLSVGDTVVLLRNQGGQQFLVLGVL